MKKLILLAGQSNMSGRDIVPPEDLIPLPGVTVLGKDGVWREAIEPITKDRDFVGTFAADGTKRVSASPWDIVLPGEGDVSRGVGPGRTFARLLRDDHPDWDIGLLPCSVGGTPISAWFAGAVDPSHPECHPYDEAIALARKAIAEGGEIVAILWHQGEGDASRRTENYADLLQSVIRNFRSDLGLAKSVPFLMGELATFYNSGIRDGMAPVNEAMHAAAAALPAVAVVKAHDFGHQGDSLHFNAESAHLFGARLFAAYRRLEGRPLPKVVLLGDSIRLGYDKYVRERLYGKAEVLFPGENCAFAQNVLRKVDMWKNGGGWGDDVALVHWNAGLWDTLLLDGEGTMTPLPVYGEFLARIHRRLRRHFPAAKLVFATSTPVLEEDYKDPGHFLRRNADIEAFNAAARRVLEPEGEAIDDLYAAMSEAPAEEHSDMTHWYTPAGTKRIGDAVLRCLAAQEYGLLRNTLLP